MTLKDNCKYCDEGIPFSEGNPIYHKTSINGYTQCRSLLAEARLEFAHMSDVEITIQEIDEIVLKVRTELEGATLETIEARCEELQKAYETLQKNAKLIKQKHISTLEERSKKLSKTTKAELKKEKAVKSTEDKLKEIEEVLKGLGKSPSTYKVEERS